MDSKLLIKQSLQRTQAVFDTMLADQPLQGDILQAIDKVHDCLQAQGKILFAGNGGSAADCQHMAAEFVGRFMFDRAGLPAIALTTDSSALTAIGNDYGFEKIFSRQIEALGRAGDVLIAYSTSGASPNILRSLQQAKSQNIICIGMTGNKPRNKTQGDIMEDLCDVTIKIPSQETPHIQEGHLAVGHLICYLVEERMFGKAS